MKISPCTKQAVCIIAFTLVVVVAIVVFGVILPKNKTPFTMGGPLSDSRGQKARKLSSSEFYRNNRDAFDYNLSEMTNRGSDPPATLNVVNPNWVRRRIGTTVNSVVANPDGTAKFPVTSNTNAPLIGDSNWTSNPWV